MSTDWIGDKETIERIANIKRETADEMFLKMRYEIIVESNTKIQYEYTGQFFDKEIIFELIDKRVVMELSTGESCGMSMQELAAINKKVEELRLEQRGEIEYG
jgi:hypothetical protein